MQNSSCCKDKGYFDKWNMLKIKIRDNIKFASIYDITEENSDAIGTLVKVLKYMEEMEETARK